MVTRGLPTKPEDLTLYVYNDHGEKFDPCQLEYSIRDEAGNMVGQPCQQPIKLSKGYYYARFTIPTENSQGHYRIKWIIKEYEGSNPYQAIESFVVE